LKLAAAPLGGRKEDKVEYECLGTTEGFGSFQFSNDSLRPMETLLDRSKEEIRFSARAENSEWLAVETLDVMS
jgi:hypothetical protein